MLRAKQVAYIIQQRFAPLLLTPFGRRLQEELGYWVRDVELTDKGYKAKRYGSPSRKPRTLDKYRLVEDHLEALERLPSKHRYGAFVYMAGHLLGDAVVLSFTHEKSRDKATTYLEIATASSGDLKTTCDNLTTRTFPPDGPRLLVNKVAQVASLRLWAQAQGVELKDVRPFTPLDPREAGAVEDWTVEQVTGQG